jgi:UDP-4-amino-4,6-dideoxy-N-acetyl-beta-L-altrosamine transaminase
MIPYGCQSVDEADVAAVVKVLTGNWLTQGPHVEEFEEALRDVAGAKHAVAFSSGTAALHGAAAAAGLGPGDSVVTSPLTFAASANCARYVGARPAFVDIDPETLNLDAALLPRDADALVAVHFAGLPMDLSALPRRPRVLIEDAAHALGATTPDGPVGNCANSDLCVFSFHPVKAITTGEGGAVTTNSAELATRLRRFRNHDIVPTPDAGGWAYEIPGDGYNYRLTDLQAALGASQLTKLDRFVRRRQELAERYRRLLADMPLELPPEPKPGSTHAYHLFQIRVDDRRRVYDALRASGIGVQVHYVPLHHHPVFAEFIPPGMTFPKTDRAYDRLLSLPLFPDLTETDQDTVVKALEEAL